MKRKLIGLLLATIMATSFVGCSYFSFVNNLKNDDSLRLAVLRTHTYVGPQFTQNSDVFYTEAPITAGGNYHDLVNEFTDVILAPNADIITELTKYNEVYKEPTYVSLTGEIKDNKMYFYYDGYVTTLDGVTQDYNKVIECDLDFDFKFNLKDLIFELDEEPIKSFDEIKNDIDAVNALDEEPTIDFGDVKKGY